MSNLSEAQFFLVQTIFDAYLIILLLRMYLQIVRANFYNPICQFIIKLTNPVVLPLRRMLPRVPYLDLSIFIPVIVIDSLKFLLIGFILGQINFSLVLIVI